MERNLKLNKKNTVLIGFAFFAILMLWQVYNNYCPIILELLLASKYGEQDLYYVIGVIMALDNVVALILIPIIGILSDRTKTKFGRRMPYILVGILASAIIFPFIVVAFMLNSLVGVIIVMGLILIVMQGYRSPAVALMPDITPKPLRSAANGLINLVGYAGAILAAGLGIVFAVKKETATIESASKTMLIPFIITSVIMLIIMVVLALNIKENELVEQNKEDLAYGEKLSESIEIVEEDKPLGKKDRKNLIIILVSAFFWFMSFNAIETFNSLFAKNILGNSGVASTAVMILTFTSIATFALLSSLSLKIGRKLVVTIGLILLITALLIVGIATFILDSQVLQYIIYGCTVLIGVGWALVNINSFPMVVELANKKNVGKFTGFYYSASMLAQSLTPILVGLVMTFNDAGLKLLYTYSAVCMSVALLVFIFVKENVKIKAKLKANYQKKKGLEKFSDPEE